MFKSNNTIRDEILNIVQYTSDCHEKKNLFDKIIGQADNSYSNAIREYLIEEMYFDLAIRYYDNVFGSMDGEQWFIFMNHGYKPDENEVQKLPQIRLEDEAWLHQVYMYLNIFSVARNLLPEEVNHRKINMLDIGCGRGGGIDCICRYHDIGNIIGCDINQKQIEFCKRRYPDSKAKFLTASASNLPFSESEFDIVINVESCHSYPSTIKFLSEVERVLRPGGIFVVTDIRGRGMSEALFEFDLLSCHMRLVCKEKITEQVKKACELDSIRFTEEHFGSPRAWLPREKARTKALEYGSEQFEYVTYGLRKV